jgi:ElaB/YqjD/DUF883 family membrane-anchored ribosome-binding protein
MATANEAYRKAANSPAGRHAAETVKDARATAKSVGEAAKSIGEELGEQVSDFASDVSRKAGKQFSRAEAMAVDAYDEIHDASVRNPHITLAIAAGLGFLLGAFLVSRR